MYRSLWHLHRLNQSEKISMRSSHLMLWVLRVGVTEGLMCDGSVLESLSVIGACLRADV